MEISERDSNANLNEVNDFLIIRLYLHDDNAYVQAVVRKSCYHYVIELTSFSNFLKQTVGYEQVQCNAERPHRCRNPKIYNFRPPLA